MGWSHHNKPPMGWPLDWDNHINDGLVSHWYMPEGSGGQILDLSGNGNTGIFVGDAYWGAGKYGSAVYMDGSDANITVPDSPILRFDSATQDFTVVAIVNKTMGSADAYVLDKRGTNDDGWRFVDISGVMWLSIQGVDVKGSTSIEDGQTHMVAASIYRSGNGQIYIDGIADGSPVDCSGQAMATTIAMTIGSRSYAGPANEWAGNIEAIYIYNRILSPSEHALLSRFPWWGFMNPDEIPVLDQYYTVTAGGIMTPNTRYWGAL